MGWIAGAGKGQKQSGRHHEGLKLSLMLSQASGWKSKLDEVLAIFFSFVVCFVFIVI